MRKKGGEERKKERTEKKKRREEKKEKKKIQKRKKKRLATIHPRSCSPTKSRKMYSGCAPPAQNRFRLSGCLSVLTLQN